MSSDSTTLVRHEWEEGKGWSLYQAAAKYLGIANPRNINTAKD